MGSDPIRGKTIRFKFRDGQMANKTFEHTFAEDGTVTFSMVGAPPAKPSSSGKGDAKPATKYELSRIRDDLYAVAYLSDGGYTLTTILDLASKKLVSFSSNEKMLQMQNGTFEYAESVRPGAHAPS